MPLYKITGFGKKTKRKRVRVYEAATQEEAFEKAYKDETIIDVAATEVLPPPPPTERQLSYAKELGIDVPENITKDELTALISEAKKRATPKQIQLAKDLRLNPPPNLTKEEMSDFLDEAMQYKKIRKRYEALPPTDAQLDFAKELGIRIPWRITRQKLSALIDKAVQEEWDKLDDQKRLGV